MLAFKPHHFLCTLGFEGKGYSESFVKGFQAIADQLRATEAGDDTQIRVTFRADSICAPCPNKVGDGCVTEDKIRRLDEAHATVLGLKDGDVLTWGEAKKKLIGKMSVEKHHEACAPCSWRSMGLCESALRRLHESSREQVG